jgi:hypothetical protein
MIQRIFISSIGSLLLLFSSSFAEVKGPGVQVKAIYQQPEQTEPGRIVSTSFLVSNHSGSEEEFLEELELPPGWQKIVTSQLPIQLEPEEDQVSVVAFLVPVTSPPGLYPICYSLKSLKDQGIVASDTMPLVVLPVEKLELSAEAKPERVLAGESYLIELCLVNRGNYKVELTLQVKSTSPSPLQMESAQLTLEPGESRTINLEEKTNQGIKQRIRQILEIKAESTRPDSHFVPVTRTVSVVIIPRVTERVDLRNKIPGRLGLVYAGGEGKGNFQIEFAGCGSVDKSGKRKIDFLFRGPDLQEKNRWGRRDEIRFSYLTRQWDLHLGDRGYHLSPLTDRQSYGRGAEANLRTGKFTVGSFFLKSRWGDVRKSKVASYVSYKPYAKLNLKGNFLIQGMNQLFSFQDYEARIYSLQTAFKTKKEMQLELECGLSQSVKERKSNDLAFRIDWTGHLHNQIDYSLERIFAGSKYLGYLTDTDYKSAMLGFPIYRELRGNLLYHDYANNLDVDSTKGTANREKTLQAGVSYCLSAGTQVSVDYKNLTKTDCVLPADFNYEESTIRLRMTEMKSKFSLSTDIERGRFEDKIKFAKSNSLERYSLYANFNPNYKSSYNFYVRIGHTSFTGNPERTKSFGLSGFWYFRKVLSLNLNYRWDDSALNNRPEQNSISSIFTYTFSGNRTLTFKSQWSDFNMGDGKAFAFWAMYNLPLEIPLSKNTGQGTLKGRVCYEEESNKTPLSRVILTTQGTMAITDEEGEFIFPSLEPGICFLQTDRSSIGLDRVPTEKLPLLIEIKTKKTTEIEIAVVRSGRIFGRVKAFFPVADTISGGVKRSSSDSLIWSDPEGKEGFEKENIIRRIGNTLVELYDEKETLRQVTDQNGWFSFEDLRPGRWALRVHTDNLPDLYFLEQKELCFELKPGEEKEIEVRVLPRLRPIQIIEEGEISNK